MGPGANVVGWFRAPIGVGAAAELVVQALDASGTPAAPVEARPLLPHGNDRSFPSLTHPLAPYPHSIICVNGDFVPGLVEQLPELFEGKRRIGYWWWEVLDAFPENWRAAFDHLDEIWVGSEHVRRAIEPHSPVPVVKVGLPITAPAPAPLGRDTLGLPAGFVFTFVFDFFSGIGRKNPLGLIEAFCEAFGPGEGASLMIKCSNGEHHPERAELLRAAAARHPDVHLLEGQRSEREVASLLAACDCYVSLHRSEGFGLPLAEALYLGRPVIATAYGGNLEFMTPDNSWLVAHRPVLVGDSGADYPPQATWAEPDLSEAARAMREVFERPDEAGLRALRGAADVRRDFSLGAIGANMRARLQARGALAPAAPRQVLREVHSWIGLGSTPPRHPWLGPLHRAVLRLIRPHTAYQATMDSIVLRALEAAEERARQAEERVGALESAQVETLAELRRMRAELEPRQPTDIAGRRNGMNGHANGSRRQRLAVFAPLTPQRTGVTRYVEALVPHLAERAEVELFVDGFTPSSPEISASFRWFDWRAQPEALDRLDGCDAVIYHVGSHADFHAGIAERALERPGIVLLHDFALQHLFFWRARRHEDRSAYLDLVGHTYGPATRAEVEAALERGEQPRLVDEVLHHPLKEALAAGSLAVAVHSHWAAERLRETVPAARVQVVPHPSIVPRGTPWPERGPGGEGSLTLASFGLMTPAKGIGPTLEALSNLRGQASFRYWLVGDASGLPDLGQMLAASGLGAQVTTTGWVDDAELDRRVLATDVGICLRERWHGEAAGVVGSLLAAGVPTVVSDVGWFSELPDDAVVKVPEGDRAALRVALGSLLCDRSLRLRVGARAWELARARTPDAAAAAQLELARDVAGRSTVVES